MEQESFRVHVPTTPIKFELASTERLAAVEALTARFYREILELDYAECLTTDESDLADFTSFGEPVAPELVRLLDRIEQHYLVDVREAQSTRIVDVLAFLLAQGVSG